MGPEGGQDGEGGCVCLDLKDGRCVLCQKAAWIKVDRSRVDRTKVNRTEPDRMELKLWISGDLHPLRFVFGFLGSAVVPTHRFKYSNGQFLE